MHIASCGFSFVTKECGRDVPIYAGLSEMENKLTWPKEEEVLQKPHDCQEKLSFTAKKYLVSPHALHPRVVQGQGMPRRKGAVSNRLMQKMASSR